MVLTKIDKLTPSQLNDTISSTIFQLTQRIEEYSSNNPNNILSTDDDSYQNISESSVSDEDVYEYDESAVHMGETTEVGDFDQDIIQEQVDLQDEGLDVNGFNGELREDEAVEGLEELLGCSVRVVDDDDEDDLVFPSDPQAQVSLDGESSRSVHSAIGGELGFSDSVAGSQCSPVLVVSSSSKRIGLSSLWSCVQDALRPPNSEKKKKKR